MMNKRLQWLILTCQFIMLLALEMSNPFIPLLVQEQTGVADHDVTMASALALMLPMIANVIMSPIWGLAADRFGYKPMLIRASLVLTISQFAVIFVHDLTTLLALRSFQGGFAGFIAAMQTYALTMTPSQHKSRQLANLQTAKALSTTCAGLVGGVILAWGGFRDLYLIASLLGLITTLIISWQLPAIPAPKAINHATQQSPSVKWQGPLIVVGLLIILSQTVRFMPDPFFSLYIQSLVSEKPWVIGLLYSMPAVGILACAPWCGRQFDRIRHQANKVRRYFYIGFGLGALLMVAHGLAANLPQLLVIRLLWGGVISAMLPALFSLVSDLSTRQGYALGLANSLAKMGNFNGLLLGGWLAGRLPLTQVFFVISLFYFLMLFLVHRYPGNREAFKEGAASL